MTESVATDCRMCGSRFSEKAVLISEMMFDTGEQFAYARCPDCGSAMIASIPLDLAPYYPSNYYSLDAWDAPDQSGAAVKARRLRLAASLRLPISVIDWLGTRGLVPHYVRWFAGLGVRPDTPILDVGSGGGHLLTNMALQGFSNLIGADPFLQDERHEGPVKLLRTSVEEITESFDIVMMNHTLEHVPDPRLLLEGSRQRLRPGGHVVVRVPALDSWPAEHYGCAWVSWDAPRHLQVPTSDGLRRACEAAGLRLVRSYRDGQAIGFWASEQYQMGIALRDKCSWAEEPAKSPFSQDQVAGWERRARALNAEGRGDAVTFVLAPA